MSIPSQLYFPGMVSPTSKLVVLKVNATDVAVLLDDSLEASELLLDDEDETARLDDELATLLGATLEELDSCAAELELLPGDEPPQAANNKNEK
jgi:hypothetical protein